MSDHLEDLPEAVEMLRTLFREKLDGVAFPDVSLEVIDELVMKVADGAKAVDDAMQKVEAAREALGTVQEELLQKCMKALAYAKIYADGQEELLDALSAIQFGKAAKTAKKNGTEKSRSTPAARRRRESEAGPDTVAEA